MLRRVVRVPGFALLTTSHAEGLRVLERVRAPSAERRERWVRAWAKRMLGLFEVEVDVVGPVPPAGARVVVMNHRSAIDTCVALHLFGGRMVSRADVATWPVVGAAAERVGTLFVDRASATSGAALLRTMREVLRAGESVNVFPEGTTFPDDEVRPFHPGAFVAAHRERCPVVPAGIAYPRASGAAYFHEPFTRHLHRLAGAPPTRVQVTIGAPISVLPDERVDALCTRARAHVQELVVASRTRTP